MDIWFDGEEEIYPFLYEAESRSPSP